MWIHDMYRYVLVWRLCGKYLCVRTGVVCMSQLKGILYVAVGEEGLPDDLKNCTNFKINDI